jgi:hypothetical protein
VAVEDEEAERVVEEESRKHRAAKLNATLVVRCIENKKFPTIAITKTPRLNIGDASNG